MDSKEQVESGKAADANVITESVLQLLCASKNQLVRDAAVIGFLSVEFDAEVVTRRILTNADG